MAITKTITQPFGRANDVRALKQRFRRIALSGTYVTGGFTVTASEVGLRAIGAVLGAGLAPATGGATANEWSYSISSDQETVTFFLYENAAAGSPSAEKTNGEAPITGQALNVVFVGW
jgi:hypothetical protein